MTYELEFDPRALKEWEKLDISMREQFKKILENPCIGTNKLRELPDCYKIKLRYSGYRLVYQIQEDRITVLVIAIGKREKSEIYEDAKYRL